MAKIETLSTTDIEKVVEKMSKKLPTRNRLYPKIKAPKNLNPEVWVQLFSDYHAGLIVKASEVGDLNSYNPAIGEKRLEYLYRTIVRILEYYPNKPTTLVIPFLGDIIEGSLIRHNQRANLAYDLINQIINASELLVNYILSLSRYFPVIKCYGIYGNHPRSTRGVTESPPAENFDRLIYWIVKEKLKGQPGISMQYTDAQHMLVEIAGWKFWLEHGDSIRSWAGIPFYGAKREKANISAMLSLVDEKADYLVLGHQHQIASFENILINGSFVGGDLNSIGRLRRFSIPSQLLFGVNPKHGVVWHRPIQLIDNPKKIKIKIYR